MTKKTTTQTEMTLVLVRRTITVIETTGEEAPSAPAARLHGPGIVRAFPVRPALRLVAGGGR